MGHSTVYMPVLVWANSESVPYLYVVMVLSGNFRKNVTDVGLVSTSATLNCAVSVTKLPTS
jgi:hypothetical protein